MVVRLCAASSLGCGWVRGGNNTGLYRCAADEETWAHVRALDTSFQIALDGKVSNKDNYMKLCIYKSRDAGIWYIYISCRLSRIGLRLPKKTDEA